MEFEPNYIGFFQFDNLVNNRVPFGLVSLDNSAENKFAEWYSGVYILHLQHHLINSTPDNFLAAIEAKKLPPHMAFVVICGDGKISTTIAQQLEAKGEMNVFVVRGGLQGLEQERGSRSI